MVLLGFALTNIDQLHNNAYASSSVDNGYTGVFNGNTQPNPLTPIGSLFTGLAVGTTFDTMTIDVGANCGGDNLEGALYDSSGNLLSASNSVLCTGGKMDVTLNSVVTVPDDGKLWAMVMSSGGHVQFNAKSTGVNTLYMGTGQSSLSFPNTIPSLAANYLSSPYIILFSPNTPLPQSPTNVSANPSSSSQIDLGWTAPNNGGSPITGYTVERSSDGGSTWSVKSNTGSTATTYSDTGLSSNTAYTYRVSAINSIGTSSPSSTVSATISPISTGTVSLTVKSADLAGIAITG